MAAKKKKVVVEEEGKPAKQSYKKGDTMTVKMSSTPVQKDFSYYHLTLFKQENPKQGKPDGWKAEMHGTSGSFDKGVAAWGANARKVIERRDYRINRTTGEIEVK